MSVAVAKKVIREFLAREKPEVLALKGSWGVGKTHAWRELIDDKAQKRWPKEYAYVSLFGLSSLTDLRIAILSSRFSGSATPGESVNAVKSVVSTIPWIKGLSAGIDALAPSLVRNMLICFDDFERLNTEKLSHDQILGFISNLKESANCKIALILNDEQLPGSGTPPAGAGDLPAGGENAYKKYREKVIDTEVQFSPTSEEATQWGLPPTLEHREAVKKLTVKLGITNVRVLLRISKVVGLLAPAISGLHAAAVSQTIESAVLLAWCYYDRAGAAPDLKFLKSWSPRASAARQDSRPGQTPEEARWTSLLNGYGFGPYDAFEAAILKVIENGYLEESGFPAQATDADDFIRYHNLELRFRAAWRPFYDSFDGNQAQVIEVLEARFREAVPVINLRDLNDLVTLLRELNEGKLADDLIEYFFKMRESTLPPLEDCPFASEVTDAKILAMFAARAAANARSISLQDAIEALTRGARTPAIITVLAAAQPNDFYAVFKARLPVQQDKAIAACLRFKSASAPHVAANATQALKQIGSESPLNAARVRRLGVPFP